MKNLTNEQAANGSSYKTANLLSDLDGNFSELNTDKAPKNNPTFTGSVTIPDPPVNANDAATKNYVDIMTALGVLWAEPVEDIVAVPPSPGVLGSRYIRSTDNVILTNIGADMWAETEPVAGTTVYVSADDDLPDNEVGWYNFNGTDWVYIGASGNHNDLTDIDGGGGGEYYHLTDAQHTVATQSATAARDGYLSSADWSTFNNKKSNSVSTTDKVLGRSSAGGGVIEEIPCTAAGRSIIGATNLADQKTYLQINNVDNTSDVNKPISTATQNALNLKANIASPTFTGTVGGITKSMVGLGNVDNTSDLNKPVSTATQNALNLKANIASPSLTGTPVAPTAAPGTNTTQLATTAFVQAAVTGGATSTASLTANTTTNVTIGNNTTHSMIIVHYRAARDLLYQAGTIRVLNASATAEDDGGDWFGDDVGMTFAANMSGANIRIGFTVDNSSATAVTLKYILQIITI